MTIKTLYLHPSELFASKIPFTIITVLGTCVAVTLWDSKLKFGGMNHFMLPEGGFNVDNPKRYGNHSTRMLVNRMFYLGSSKKNLKAKVVGGSYSTLGVDSIYQVGAKNINSAIQVLNDMQVQIVEQDVGGNRARKLKFLTSKGVLYIHYFKPKIAVTQ